MLTDIRQLRPGEEENVISLIRESFDLHISPHYSAQGIAEFYKYIEPHAIQDRLLHGHQIYTAQAGGVIAGVAEIRNPNHISLLFVNNMAKGTGIGKKILQYIEDMKRREAVVNITVNSSPNSVDFYTSQGFVPIREPFL